VKSKERLQGKKILLVDDEPDVLDTLEDLLPMCETHRASTYETAREMMATQPFDMAVLDVMGVQGYDLLALANQKGISAVMLTARALSAEDVKKSFNEGAASFVPKERMADIEWFLSDILEAAETGRHPWWRWYDRLSAFADRTFGPELKSGANGVLDKIPFW
jgi:CheY-like chemotaxis protein